MTRLRPQRGPGRDGWVGAGRAGRIERSRFLDPGQGSHLANRPRPGSERKKDMTCG
jgi:hypothetical protein